MKMYNGSVSSVGFENNTPLCNGIGSGPSTELELQPYVVPLIVRHEVKERSRLRVTLKLQVTISRGGRNLTRYWWMANPRLGCVTVT